MTQFMYTDLMRAVNQEEIIDKSIMARHHAQFISHQIADEGRLNNHSLKGMNEFDCSRLIRQHKLAFIEYPQDVDELEQGIPLPKGLEKHEVYLIKQEER